VAAYVRSTHMRACVLFFLQKPLIVPADAMLRGIQGERIVPVPAGAAYGIRRIDRYLLLVPATF
jgi:hypothetical protein